MSSSTGCAAGAAPCEGHQREEGAVRDGDLALTQQQRQLMVVQQAALALIELAKQAQQSSTVLLAQLWLQSVAVPRSQRQLEDCVAALLQQQPVHNKPGSQAPEVRKAQ